MAFVLTWVNNQFVVGGGHAVDRRDEVGQQHVGQHAAYLRGDLVVRAQEQAEQVAAADDAQQVAVRIHHGEAPQVLAVKEAARRPHRRGRMNGYRGARSSAGGTSVSRQSLAPSISMATATVLTCRRNEARY
jgi:hypothetical protein